MKHLYCISLLHVATTIIEEARYLSRTYIYIARSLGINLVSTTNIYITNAAMLTVEEVMSPVDICIQFEWFVSLLGRLKLNLKRSHGEQFFAFTEMVEYWNKMSVKIVLEWCVFGE